MNSQLLRRLHRITGVVVALPVILLVITGIPLQFTTTLSLGHTWVPWNWVLDSYGISAPQQASHSNGVTQLAQAVWINGHRLSSQSALRGALRESEFTLVAFSEQLLLVPAEADVPAETLAAPASIYALGRGDNNSWLLDTEQGVLRSADFGASWQPHQPEPQATDWTEVIQQPATTRQQQQYRREKLSWERWLQDLHSGRFFGAAGEWLMTLASAALVLLSLTGLIVWLRMQRRPH